MTELKLPLIVYRHELVRKGFRGTHISNALFNRVNNTYRKDSYIQKCINEIEDVEVLRIKKMIYRCDRCRARVVYVYEEIDSIRYCTRCAKIIKQARIDINDKRKREVETEDTIVSSND